jgi:hypothetical protein
MNARWWQDAFNTSTRQSRRLRIATFHTPQQHEGAWTLRIQALSLARERP